MGANELEERICDAALTCVARWGLTKTTLEDVARQAGCGRATIYRHFPTRADLVIAVYRHQVEACAEAGPALLEAVLGRFRRWFQRDTGRRGRLDLADAAASPCDRT